MLPLVLGGIAIAAIGYGLKEYCEEEGCPWDEESSSNPTKTSTQNVWSTYKSTKQSLYDHELSQLSRLLDKVKESKYTIDETLVFAEETYDGLWDGMSMHPLHMYHKDVADKQEKRKIKEMHK